MQQAAVIVWCLTDNKPGHRNQLRGLTDALGKLLPVEPYWIDVPPVWSALGQFIAGIFSIGRKLPAPQLICGAGHRTHWSVLAARRARGGRAIILMRPTLPTGWFDLCLIPEHDAPATGPRIVATRGALHAVTPSSPAMRQARQGLFLIGGPSAHHAWDDVAIAEQVRAIVTADTSWQWVLTTSRRTPRQFLDRLGQLPNLVVTPVEQTDVQWVANHLARVATVWVTEDSVSMVYEALTSGATVGLLEVPHRGHSRIVRGIEQLVTDGLVTPFANWRSGNSLNPPPVSFHEAARCAALIRDRFLRP